MNNLIAYTNMYLAETINLQTDDKIGSAVGDLKVEDLVSGFNPVVIESSDRPRSFNAR